MTTPTAEGLTPDLFGYVKCVRCGCWRPISETRLDQWGISAATVCVDVAWCGRQAGVGRGELAPEAL